MEIAKNILIVVYIIVSVVLTILALIQTKEDSGVSSTITGSSTNNFYEKKKVRNNLSEFNWWKYAGIVKTRNYIVLET